MLSSDVVGVGVPVVVVIVVESSAAVALGFLECCCCWVVAVAAVKKSEINLLLAGGGLTATFLEDGAGLDRSRDCSDAAVVGSGSSGALLEELGVLLLGVVVILGVGDVASEKSRVRLLFLVFVDSKTAGSGGGGVAVLLLLSLMELSLRLGTDLRFYKIAKESRRNVRV